MHFHEKKTLYSPGTQIRQPFRLVEQGNNHVIYTVSRDKFHDRGYSGILYGINSIDIIGCCTQLNYVFYYPDWVN